MQPTEAGAFMTVLFELCAPSLEAAIFAERGGASRVELCEDLAIGGVTPSDRLLADTLRSIHLPVHVLIRPRGGDFCYSADEFEAMEQDVLTATRLNSVWDIYGSRSAALEALRS